MGVNQANLQGNRLEGNRSLNNERAWEGGQNARALSKKGGPGRPPPVRRCR